MKVLLFQYYLESQNLRVGKGHTLVWGINPVYQFCLQHLPQTVSSLGL